MDLVWANIKHRLTRSFVTAIGVALGTILILLTVGLARGFIIERGKRESNVGAEIMVRSGFSAGISSNQPSVQISFIEDLKKIKGIRTSTPVIQYIQSSDTGFGFRSIEAVEFEDYSRISGIQIIKGKVAQTDTEINIDEELARSRKIGPGSEIEVMGRLMKVAGIYSPESGSRIKLKLSTMQDMLAASGLCSMILVKCDNSSDQTDIARKVQKIFEQDQIILTRDLPNLYANGLPALNIFLRVVIGLASGISILVILLTMYTTISERTREIGILKSLGATNRFILKTIEQEAILISLIGALFGLIISIIAKYFIIHTTTIHYIQFEAKWIFITFGVAMLGGSLGAIYPALKAIKVDPVKALNYE